MTWGQSLLLLCGLLIVACGCIAAIPQKSKSIKRFDARVGRDCYREFHK
jgi:hypothetical protein